MDQATIGLRRSPLLSWLLIAVSGGCSARQTQRPSPPSPWLLPLTARQQWTNDNGYCGETSIQSIALYYGVWLSQERIRDASGGELLVGVNSDRALAALQFSYENWSRDQPVPQYNKFMVWIKKKVAAGIPVVFASYLQGEGDPNYDHIMAVTGIEPHHPDPDVFDPQDVVVFHNNYATQPLRRTFAAFAATRDTCREPLLNGGCVPRDLDFGVAISGLVDSDRATTPLSLAVNAPDEANVSIGLPSRALTPTVSVRRLTPGRRYALLRYSDPAAVPTAGGSAAFLQSQFDSRVDFTAESSTWSYTDPALFDSRGAVYYRCVAAD